MFSDFIELFFSNLNYQEIRWCVIRNYEEFPAKNLGSDIDIVIDEEQLLDAIQILKEMPGISITNKAVREYVTSLYFVNNNNTGLQIDFITKLTWKGLIAYDLGSVLSRIQKWSRWGYCNIPDNIDEAILMLLHSYIYGGFVNKKYLAKIQGCFYVNYDIVIQRLGEMLGRENSTKLVDALIQDNQCSALKVRKRIVLRLIFSNLINNPFSTLTCVCKHYFLEICLRIKKENLSTIVILGPDGVGKSTVINGLKSSLAGYSKNIKYVHLKPDLKRRKINQKNIVTDPHALPPRGSLLSTIKISLWFFQYWLGHMVFIINNRSPTIIIYDRYFDDLLVDPIRYRYGGSAKIANLLAAFLPKPDIYIYLHADMKTIYGRKQEISSLELSRQIEAYYKLVESKDKSIVIDASRSIESVIENVKIEIKNVLAARHL